MNDEVNNPPHYNQGSVECINGIEAALGSEGALSYYRGNILKYVWRCMYKGKPLVDLKKARWYLDRAIQTLGKTVGNEPTSVKSENPVKDKSQEKGPGMRQYFWEQEKEHPETD